MKISFSLFTLIFSLSIYAQNLELIIPVGHTKSVNDITVSNDGLWTASSDGTNRIIFWDSKSKKELYHLKSHTLGVLTILFQGDKLISGSVDGTLKIWDLKGRLTASLDLEGAVEKVVSTSETELVVALVGNVAHKINIKTGEVIASISLDIDEAKSGAFLKETNQLAIGNNSGELSLLDLSTFKPSGKKVTLTDKRIGTIKAFGEKLAVGTDNGEVIILDSDLKELARSNPFAARTYSILVNESNGKLIACGRGAQSNFKILSLSDLSEIASPLDGLEKPGSETFRAGLRSMTWMKKDSSFLLADYNQNLISLDASGKMGTTIFKGHAQPIFDIDLDPSGEHLAIAFGHAEIDIVDLTGVGANIKIPTLKSIRTVDFHPVNPMIATYSLDDVINVWDLKNKKSVADFKAKSRYSTTPATFDPTGNYLIRRNSDKDFDLYNFRRSRPKNLKVKDGRKFEFSQDGRRLYFQSKDGILQYDPVKLVQINEVSIPQIQDFDISKDGNIAVLLRDDKTIQIYSEDLQKVNEAVLSDTGVDRIVWSHKENLVVGFKNSTKKGQLQADYNLYLIDANKGEIIKTIGGHQAFVNKVQFHSKSGLMVTSAIDGMINFWNINEKEPYKASYIQFENGEYVVSASNGLYDASPFAMSLIHYSKNGEIIGLEQMKSYYEPNLLPKLLGFLDEPVRPVSNLDELKLFPDIKINHPLHNDGKIGVTLNDQGGGIGRIVIIINGKEVSSDARDIIGGANHSTVEFDYEIDGHPYLLENKVNKITIKAYNEDGTIASQDKNIYLLGEKNNTEETKPQLFAIIAGTSDYSGDQLDLKFAAKDAIDFAKALQLASQNFLGVENIDVRLLTTDNEDKNLWPSKTNIEAAFNDVSKKANANDILVVYLSGHGTNYGGAEGDFYYLTTLTEDGDLSDEKVRERVGISSVEFTEMIKSVPALKQVMVIDACHSGRLATNLVQSRSTMSSTHIRALERIKDRTGLFVLAGSAADAVSYETTLFDQGLLTYSLLFGMKGAALRNDEFLDVMELFQFAANKVPELAEDIGGIQKPQIRLPVGASSFDIGRMEDHHRDKIIIKEPKPAFINSSFQDQTAIYDPLGMTNMMDAKLMELGSIQESQAGARLKRVQLKNYLCTYVRKVQV